MSEPVTIACVWVGDRYSADYLSILMDMVRRNLSPAWAPRFVCITDRPGDLPEGMEAIEPEPGLPGWWQKVALFKPGKLPGERIAYFDLDVAIAGPLDALVARPGIIKDWHLPGYNSSVMVWDAGSHATAWSRFRPRGMKELHGDQDWLTKVGGWELLPPEWCKSYRSHARAWPPSECKVVVFHGAPKPHEVSAGWVPLLWRLGGLTALPKLQGVNVPRPDLLDNIRENCKRDLTWFTGQPEHERECCIVGGGPSVAGCLEDIGRRVADGAALVSLNGALSWLRWHGLRPTSHVVLDARQENVEFARGIPRDTTVLVASQCHPALLDALQGHEKTILWHAGLHYEELEEILKPYSDDCPVLVVGGGSTVGLRAMFLAHLSGFRRLHLYGFDSCYSGETHHAYAQALNDGDPRMTVMMAGKSYECAPWMARQAEEFNGQHAVLTREGTTIEAHGSGLIPDICRLLNAQVAISPTVGLREVERIDGVWWPKSELHGQVSISAEVAKVDAILSLCRGRSVAVQAGANVGLVPMRLLQDFDRVIAFEPDPTNARAARLNINGAKVELFEAALGERGGTVCMCGPAGNCGALQTSRRGGNIPVVTIDSLALPACDLIMLDIEGDEVLALNGAAETIKAHRPVVVIEAKGLGARHGWFDGSVVRWFTGTFGYREHTRLGRDIVFAPAKL